MTGLLFRIGAQRLRNTIHHYRTNNQKQLRIVMMVVFGVFVLWFDVFRHVVARHEMLVANWSVVRLVFPSMLAGVCAAFGGYRRQSQWIARWSTGSWSVLPVDPRSIAPWLLGSIFAVDLLWWVLGIVISAGMAYILKLDWLREFPFLLFGLLLLVAAASMAKVLATSLLRLGSERLLNRSNWILRFLASFLAVIFLQPLAMFWWIAEFGRQHGSLFVPIAALLFLAFGIAGLTIAARAVLENHWSDMIASFEVQQTQRRTKEKLRLANFLADRMRSPVSRIFTLYNLRSGIQLSRWGQPINVGGRRIYMLIAMLAGVLFMLFFMAVASLQENSSLPFAIGGGAWTSMLVISFLPPVFPPYRLLRMLPVTFSEWLRAILALPLAVSGTMIVLCGVAVSFIDPTTAYQSYAIMLGIFLAVVPFRIVVLSAYPDAQQTGDIIFFIAAGIGGLVFYFVSWMAVVPLVLVADIYFFNKAAREWRGREEGLHA